MASQIDRFIDGKFLNLVNPKDGYAMFKCKDARARRVLEFLVPILYPEKPGEYIFVSGEWRVESRERWLESKKVTFG